MKKIIYTFVVISLLIGCKKDAELPALAFNFSVTESQQNFSDKGVNEAVTIDFDIKTDYDFTKVPLKYKIETTEQSEISDGIKKILPNDTYTLQEPKLKIIYTGKNKAEHKIKVTFENQKGFTIEKQFSLNYKEYGYKIDISQGNKTPHQGENVDFNLRITPENTSVNDFFIIFKSYDDQDPNLEKTLVALNGEKITFDKEYKIEDLSNVNIRLNSFNIGTKQLKYVIKNSTFQREEIIEQNVTQNKIQINSFKFNKQTTDNQQEMLNLKGFVLKTPKISNKIWYKTWISVASNNNKEAIDNTKNKYVEMILPDNNEFSLNVNTQYIGVYVYNIQFKDEFGNESDINEFNIHVKDKTYIINQTNGDFSNIHQGQTAQILFKIEEADTTNETYKISFIEFDNQDIFLNKSSILFNGNTVGLNTEIEITDLFNNKIEVNSFHQGDKKLVYKIWNSVGKEIIKETIINFKKAPISSEIEIRSSYVQGETFTLTGKVNTLSREGKIKYKTWAEIQKKKIKRNFIFFDYETYFEETQDIPTTNSDWLVYDLDNNKRFELTQNLQNIGTYRYYIQFQDEFGNESQPQMLSFSVDPPIVIDELKLKLYSSSRGEVGWNLILKARNINDTALLTHVDVYLPNTEQIFSVSYKGKVHTLTINSYKNHDYFGLDNKRDVDINEYCDWEVRINYKWNINLGYDTDAINSVKILLREKFQNEYKSRVVIHNSRGHNIVREVKFSNINSLE